MVGSLRLEDFIVIFDAPLEIRPNQLSDFDNILEFFLVVAAFTIVQLVHMVQIFLGARMNGVSNRCLNIPIGCVTGCSQPPVKYKMISVN